jgi:hypothetical protein
MQSKDFLAEILIFFRFGGKEKKTFEIGGFCLILKH